MQSPTAISQELAKFLNYSSDAGGHIPKRLEEGLTKTDCGFSEDYLKSELHIIVEFRAGRLGDKFVAYLERAEGFAGGPLDRHESQTFWNGRALPLPRALDIPAPKWGDAVVIDAGVDRYQQAMLVDVVKLIENPQDMPTTALVRLDLAERFYGFLPRTLYMSLRDGPVIRGGAFNGKPNRFGTSTIRSDSVRQIIEGASHIGDSISSDQLDTCGDLPKVGQLIRGISRFMISIGSDLVWFGQEEGADFGLEITDVLFGPYKSRFGKMQRF